MTDVTFKSPKSDIWNAYKELLTKLASSPISDKVIEKIDQNTSQLSQALFQEVEKIVSQIKKATQVLSDIQRAKVDLELKTKSEDEEIKKKRARDEEEYQYDFEKRKKRQEDDLNSKKDEIKNKDLELNDLRNLVKTFDQKLESAVKTAVLTKEKELKMEHEHEKALSHQKETAVSDLLNAKIENLTRLVEDLKNENVKLKEMANTASDHLTRIAEKAVEKNLPKTTL